MQHVFTTNNFFFKYNNKQMYIKSCASNIKNVPVPWVGLQCVIVAFPCHTHLPFHKTSFVSF